MYLPVCYLQFQPCVLVWDVSLIYSSLWMFYRIMNKDMDVLLQTKKVKWKYGKYNKPVDVTTEFSKDLYPGLLTCMHSMMDGQTLILSECLSAYITFIRPCASMNNLKVNFGNFIKYPEMTIYNSHISAIYIEIYLIYLVPLISSQTFQRFAAKVTKVIFFIYCSPCTLFLFFWLARIRWLSSLPFMFMVCRTRLWFVFTWIPISRKHNDDDI